MVVNFRCIGNTLTRRCFRLADSSEEAPGRTGLTGLFIGRDNGSIRRAHWERLSRRSKTEFGGLMDAKISMLIMSGLVFVVASVLTPAMAQTKRKPGLYATIQTNQGT